MKKIDFYFALDSTFKKGVDITEAKQKRKAGKNIDSLYNPCATSIYLGCTVNATYIKINTGFKIKPAEWDFTLQRPLKKYVNYLELNAFISKLKSKAEAAYLRLLTNESLISPSVIKEILINAKGADKIVADKPTFWKVYEEFIIDKARNTKSSTMEKYNSTKVALVGFEKKNYKLSFEKMTLKFCEDFKIFSALTLKHLNNTTSKSLRNIKTFLAWAENHPNKYNSLLDYKKFKGDSDLPEVIFLTESELESFEKFDTGSNMGLSLSKEKFVFQCYTGQRIGDVLKVKKQDIRPVGNGQEKEWVLYQEKGNKNHPIFIPILDKADEIIKRRCKDLSDDDLIFPGQAKKTLLDNIKDIAKGAGINTSITKVNYRGKNRVEQSQPKYKFIGTHVARKTFISLCLQKGISPEDLMTISGHTSVKQMRPYIGTEKIKFNLNLREKWNKNGNEHSTSGEPA